MEPNHNIIASPTELPQPQEANSGNVAEFGVAAIPEKSSTKSSIQDTPLQQSNTTAAIDPGASQLSDFSVIPANDSNQPHGALMADDTDLIEKEWVIRAKSIVTQTKDDPHLQNKEMNKVKADYMKKRYNKDLKVSEG